MALHSSNGNVIQTVPVFKGNRFTTSSTSYVDITGMSVTITPKFANSDIQIAFSFGAAGVNQSNLDHGNAYRILRSINGGSWQDNHNLNGSSDGGRNRITFRGHGWAYNNDHMPGGVGYVGVDVNPSYSLGNSIVYKIQTACQATSYPFYLNGTNANTNGAQIYMSRSCSSIIATELGG